MINYNDIAALLESGMTAEELANSFAADLNAEIKAREEREKAIQEAKAKADADKTRQKEMLDNVLTAVFDYLEAYMPELYDAELRELKADDELIAIADAAYADTLQTIKKMEEQDTRINKVMAELDKMFGGTIQPQFKRDPEEKPLKRLLKKDPLAEFLIAEGLMK